MIKNIFQIVSKMFVLKYYNSLPTACIAINDVGLREFAPKEKCFSLIT